MANSMTARTPPATPKSDYGMAFIAFWVVLALIVAGVIAATVAGAGKGCEAAASVERLSAEIGRLQAIVDRQQEGMTR